MSGINHLIHHIKYDKYGAYIGATSALRHNKVKEVYQGQKWLTIHIKKIYMLKDKHDNFTKFRNIFLI